MGLLAVPLLVVLLIFVSGQPTYLSEEPCGRGADSPQTLANVPVPNEETKPLSNFDIYCGRAPADGRYVLADVAVDQSFQQAAGPDWAEQAQRTVRAANQILTAVRVQIEVGSLQTWNGNGAFGHISGTLAAAEQMIERSPGRLLVVLSGVTSSKFDGWAKASSAAFIIRHYPNHPERAPVLMAHELGHLLGAGHRCDDPDCGDGDCIMAATGYVRANDWCHHHLDEIEENIAARMRWQHS